MIVRKEVTIQLDAHHTSTTRVQLEMLVGLVNHLKPFVFDDPAWHSDGEKWKDSDSGGPIDGGVAAAAHTTLIGAFGRIDRVLDEDKRWRPVAIGMTEMAKKTLMAQQALCNAELANHEAARKPHRIASPSILFRGGRWLAVLDDVIGSGPTPLAACESFDAVFEGRELADRLAQQQSLSPDEL